MASDIETVTRVLAEHILSEASGGTAYEAYAVCSCGERNAISGGLREMAYRKGLRHVAAEVVAALNLHGVRAQAWDEGHKARQRLDPDDGCQCGAWASHECGCGRYGTGALLSLADNPHRIEGGTAKAREAALAAIVPVDGYTPEDF